MENKKRDDTATLTAEACGCSAAYVRQLIRGDRKANTDKAKAIITHYESIINAKHKMAQPTEAASEN